MLRVAIGINIFAIIWVIILINYVYIGTIIGVLAVIWFFVLLKKKQDKIELNFQKRFPVRNIRCLDKCAIFRAQESSGYSQIKGMGYLVLTEDELYFEMILFNKIISIPTASIIKVGKTNRLLGVNPGKPMLKIEFNDKNKKNDSIALNVKELKKWQEAITLVINN